MVWFHKTLKGKSGETQDESLGTQIFLSLSWQGAKSLPPVRWVNLTAQECRGTEESASD